MARGSRVANEYGFVQDVADIYIGYNNQSMQIGEGYVAQYGVIRQFWPSTTITQTGIVMTTAAVDSYAIGNTTAKAILTYDAQSGELILSDETDTIRIPGISPPPRSTGQYLFRIDIVSGDIQSNDAIGVWLDTNSEGTLGLKEYWIDQSVNGFSTGQVTLKLAEDDGAGAPLAGTEVNKLVRLKAEVLSAVICMSTQPWLLDNTEYNELAECWVLTIPLGWYDPAIQQTVDTASINGEYGYPKGIQFSEIYACSWTALITVQVDVVSGGPVIGGDGEQTGVAYSTSERRRWKIEAEPGNTSDAVVDVTISDGIESVVKRVTMTCESIIEDSASSISDDFTRTDFVEDFRGPHDTLQNYAAVYFDVLDTGLLDSHVIWWGDPSTFPQDWNTAATTVPDPENYECQWVFVDGYPLMYWLSGPGNAWVSLWDEYTIQRKPDPWFNLGEGQEFRYFWSARNDKDTQGYFFRDALYDLNIREVGRPETIKTKRVKVKLTVWNNRTDY